MSDFQDNMKSEKVMIYVILCHSRYKNESVQSVL